MNSITYACLMVIPRLRLESGHTAAQLFRHLVSHLVTNFICISILISIMKTSGFWWTGQMLRLEIFQTILLPKSAVQSFYKKIKIFILQKILDYFLYISLFKSKMNHNSSSTTEYLWKRLLGCSKLPHATFYEFCSWLIPRGHWLRLEFIYY